MAPLDPLSPLDVQGQCRPLCPFPSSLTEPIRRRAWAAQRSIIGTCGDSSSLAKYHILKQLFFPFKISLCAASLLSSVFYLFIFICIILAKSPEPYAVKKYEFSTDACKILDAWILCHTVLCGDQETKG